MRAQIANRAGKHSVFRHNEAAVAQSTEILRREEGDRRRAYAAASASSNRLRCVLEHGHTQGGKLIEVRAAPKQIDRQDRARSRSPARERVVWVEVQVAADLGEDGCRTQPRDCLRRRSEAKRRGNHLVTRPDTVSPERREDRVTPGRHANRLGYLEHARDLALEGGHLFAENEMCRVEDARDGRVERLADRGVQAREIDESNVHVSSIAKTAPRFSVDPSAHLPIVATMSGVATTTGEDRLRREVGTWLGILIVINSTIGTGIFKVPAKVARMSGGLGASFVVWIVGAVIALAGALTLAELAAAIPRAGGLYEYLRRAYHPVVSFLLGWTKLTLLIPSAVGSFAKLSAEAVGALLGLPASSTRDALVALGIIVGCAVVNLFGVHTSAVQQGAITVLKYLGVAFLAVVGLCVPVAAGVHVPVPDKPPPFEAVPTLSGMFTSLVSVMWAYDGWADLSSMAGEVRNPSRTLPRALFAGTAGIAVVYLAANAGYASAIGLEGLRNSTTGSNMAAANLAFVTLGVTGRTLLSAIILVSCIGVCMASLMTGSRIFVPMSSDGQFIRGIGRVSPRGVPTRAVLVSAAMGAIYVLFRSFEQLTDAFVVGYFPFYALAVGSVFVLRKREPNLDRPFRVPLYPIVPLVFLAGALILMIGALGDVDRTALFALGVLLLGLPVWAIWRKLK
jgi:APA family basic amino acid/polyamine antiporter